MLGGKWFFDYSSPDLALVYRMERTIYSGKTRFQVVDLLESSAFGRCLLLDGKMESTERDEFIYHEALVHPPMIAHPNPRRVFIGGGGEGATAREVLRHRTVERVVMVDIDAEVVELCRQHLPGHHQGAFEDPRLSLHIADARAFLQESGERFDVIVMDVADPIEGGPAYLLYTLEFYQLARDRLTEGGLLVTEAGSGDIINYHEVFTPVFRTMSTVFPQVAGYTVTVPAFGGLWAFVVGSLGPNPAILDPAEVDRRLAQRVAGELRLYDGTTHAHMFSLPRYLRRALQEERRVATDASPPFMF